MKNEMMTPMQNMSKKMDSMHMTGNPDHDFAEMMIVHHQAAIEMAQTEIDSGKDTTIKKLAKRIIEDQTKEIEEMQQWLKNQH
ncbi:MAG: DUF305 domain-containing protein [Bacteroidetes bacterium]|nr:DUF305 domain-containing protein [Bacteroidota bacterium]